MTEEQIVAVIVPDREMRDLICLNLRFESVKTSGFETLQQLLESEMEFSLVIIDLCGERSPDNVIKNLVKTKSDLPVIALYDHATSPMKHKYSLQVETRNGRKRFDASNLITLVNELIESHQSEPVKHPLTGLPAGNAVEKHIASLLAEGKVFSLICSDMDNMKAFNQRFGYAEGDDLLIHLVRLMSVSLEDNPHNLNYIGHRGEDDFVIITSPDLALKIAEEVIDGFDAMVQAFFNDDDLENGYFVVNDRKGNMVKFPLTTVSLVVVNTEGRYFTHPAELYDAAEELMTQVKMRGIHQSYCAVDKRASKPGTKELFI